METVAASMATATGGTQLPWLDAGAQIGSMAGNISLPSFSLLSTIGGSALQIQSGNLESQRYKMQAEQNVLNARVEKLNAEEKANEIRRNLLSNLSSAKATFASRGVVTSSGTPLQAATEAAKNASVNIEKARFGGTIAANEKIAQAQQDKISGKSARMSGYGAAADTLSKSKSIRSLLEF
jgi:hypothetical protein